MIKVLSQDSGMADLTEKWRLCFFSHRRDLHQLLEHAYTVSGRHSVIQTG
jgi:hypothetical protein